MSGAIFALMQKYKKKKLLAIRDKVITNAPAPPAIKAKTVKARRKRTSAKPGTNKKTRGAKIVKAAQKINKKPIAKRKPRNRRTSAHFADISESSSSENDSEEAEEAASEISDKDSGEEHDGSGSNSEGSAEDDAFEVAEILDDRMVEEDCIIHAEYLCRWKPMQVNGKRKTWKDSWVPAANLRTCEYRIAMYLKKKEIAQVTANTAVDDTPTLHINKVYAELLAKEPHPVPQGRHTKLWAHVQAETIMALQLVGTKRKRRTVQRSS